MKFEELPQDIQQIGLKAIQTGDQEMIKKFASNGVDLSYIKQPEPITNPTGPSKTESFLRGAAQGATFNLGDELSAGLELGVGKLTGNEAYKGKSFSDLVGEYRKENKAAQEANPKSYLGGNIAGTVLTTPLLPEIAAANPVKAATAIGATQGYGASEGTAGQQLKGTAIGAGAGLLGGLIAKAITSSPETIEKASVDLARRALGFNRGLINRINPVSGLQKANQAAKVVLNEGGIINPMNDLQDMSLAVTTMKEKAGETMGNVLDALDKANIQGIDTGEITNAIRNAKITPQFSQTVDRLSRIPALKELAAPLQNALETVHAVSEGQGTIGFSQAQELKQIFRTMADFTSENDKPASLLANKMYGIINESIDNAVEKGAPQIGAPQLANAFKQAKSSYMAASRAETAVGDAIKRVAGNRKYGLMDALTILGGAQVSMQHGSPGIGALVALAAKKAIEDRGYQTGAVIGKYASQVLKPAAKKVGDLLSRIGIQNAAIPIGASTSEAINQGVQ